MRRTWPRSLRVAFCALLVVISASLGEAVCGWYLLVPSRSPYDAKARFLQGFKILTDMPLSRWSHQGSYESAEGCEGAKSTQVRTEHSMYSKSVEEYQRLVADKSMDEKRLSTQRYLAENQNAIVAALAAARCIATHDPRLR